MALKFIDAYDKTTKAKVRIPAHWLDVPSIAKNFSQTSRQKGASKETPANTATVEAPIETPATGVNEKE